MEVLTPLSTQSLCLDLSLSLSQTNLSPLHKASQGYLEMFSVKEETALHSLSRRSVRRHYV